MNSKYAARTNFVAVWTIDALYFLASLGEALFIVLAIRSQGVLMQIAFLADDGDYLTIQLVLLLSIVMCFICVALGVLSLVVARTPVVTGVGAMTAVSVCFVPLAFALHYLWAGREAISKVVRSQ